jgi:uncharacterized C2H2 Zn-finger protein
MYRCDICNFITVNKKDYTRHLQTAKHLKNLNIKQHDELGTNNLVVNNNILVDIPYHKCDACNMSYRYKSGLSRHLRGCIKYNQFSNENKITHANETHNIINKLLHEHDTFKHIIMEFMKTNNEVVKSTCELTKNTNEIIKSNQEIIANQQETTNKVLELCKNNAASVTNNNIYNHKGDNHFSINLFLNEKCKDAMNITDFVNSIELSMEDMENVGRNGYVKGISSIFIENLKNTDIHKRPIHCSDRKREVLYVKEQDKWEREGVNSDNLIKAVRTVEQKNIIMINEWAKQHPECENSDTYANDLYMQLSKHGYDGEDDNIVKVVKNIAKETVIERSNLLE